MSLAANVDSLSAAILPNPPSAVPQVADLGYDERLEAEERAAEERRFEEEALAAAAAIAEEEYRTSGAVEGSKPGSRSATPLSSPRRCCRNTWGWWGPSSRNRVMVLRFPTAAPIASRSIGYYSIFERAGATRKYM